MEYNFRRLAAVAMIPVFALVTQVTPAAAHASAPAPRWAVSASVTRSLEAVGLPASDFTPGWTLYWPQNVPGTPATAYPSEAAIAAVYGSGALPGAYQGVGYDAECWIKTPAVEQASPGWYFRLAAAVVHAHGQQFIAMPSITLAGCSAAPQDYLNAGIPAKAARHADVFLIQAERLEGDAGQYASFVAAAAAQARRVNPSVVVIAELLSCAPVAGGCSPVPGSQLVADWQAAISKVPYLAGAYLGAPDANLSPLVSLISAEG